MTEWSFQLYSARNHPPLSTTLQLLAELGYTQVEGFGGLYDQATELRQDLDRNGLSMPTGHFGLALLQDQVDDARRIIETLGVETVICPHLTVEQRPANAEGWKQMAETLNAVGKPYLSAGLGFGWHNHDFEFVPLENGQTPMEILLENSELGWEMDLAWVVRGKADPQEWIRRYGNRLCAVHVKDIAPAGENPDEDGWADVGHGVIDWPGLYTQLRQTPAQWYVMEHDKPSDVARFARRSLETVQSFAE
jgi:sugar phosphate isomerase/epimerase